MTRQTAILLQAFCSISLAADAPTHTLITEPTQGLTPVYNLLRSAARTVDLTMYELADHTAEQLLAEAAARHVAVRVILDRNLELHNNQAAYDYLQTNGVQVVWAAKQYAATHQKSIVVDGATAAILTLNLTSRYYTADRDYAVFDTDPADVAAIEQVFEADFTGAAIDPPAASGLVWSPTGSRASLLDVIRSAHTSLQIESEEMSDSGIVNALVEAARSGVRVQVVMTYSESYLKNFTKLAQAGVQVSLYSPDAAIYIHGKVILADYGMPGALLFAGSENFSGASLDRNRELGLVVTDPAILTSVYGTLSEDVAGATPW